MCRRLCSYCYYVIKYFRIGQKYELFRKILLCRIYKFDHNIVGFLNNLIATGETDTLRDSRALESAQVKYVHRGQRHTARHIAFGNAGETTVSSVCRQEHRLHGTRMLKVKKKILHGKQLHSVMKFLFAGYKAKTFYQCAAGSSAVNSFRQQALFTSFTI